MVAMLVEAESRYRQTLVDRRQWIIEQKIKAEAEQVRRKEERERKERELQEKLARERVGRLLAQAKSLRRATDIRDYVDAALLRAAEVQLSDSEANDWAAWARKEADRIDPVKNGSLTASILESKAE